MAAAAVSSSNPHDSYPYSGKWEYDVFLCFRGADTRHGFTSHLKAALSDKQIRVFIDDMLDKTESIDELTSVLQRSALSVVIFSENFADSSWCLDEVATISQSMIQFGHRVLPVFYKVDPSDVSEDSGSYAAAIEQKHGTGPSKKRKKKHGASKSMEDWKRWMDALKAVANCTGHTSRTIQIDSELVEAIVKDVHDRLAKMSSRVHSDNLIGMDARVSKVEELLAMNMNDFRIVELWGMGGVGKTTLARACYRRLLSLTKGIKQHFVHDINQRCEHDNGMVRIVTELYSALLSESRISYDDLDVRYRRSRLSRLRVFLVFDDVRTLSQLEQLLMGDLLSSTNLFAPGSRIILTTRNRMMLGNVGARIYHVDILDPDESLQLFRIHAFGRRIPPDDFMDLSHHIVSYCDGCPLALKVSGGLLADKDTTYWHSFLSDMRQISNRGINDVLKRSYNALGADERRLFLDIACLFYQPSKSLFVKYAHANHLLEDLIDRSLVICFDKEFERIEVHGLLREMAWSIVNEESKLEKRTRLQNFDDVHKLLTRSSSMEGCRATEGITLDLSEADEMHLEGNAFEGMTSLRFLSFIYSGYADGASKVHVPYGGLDILPDSLRWLQWDGFSSNSLPSTFCPENLVLLSLRGSLKMERCWERAQPILVNLGLLDLSHCINIVALPDLSLSLNLQYLILVGCKSLIELPSYVEDLDKLIELRLDECSTLQSLPAKLNSKFLESVLLSNCPKVTHCPEINSRKLEILDLMETPVIHLPDAIYNVKHGGILRLCGKHITSFPTVSTSLKWFQLCHTTIREMDCYADDDQHHTQQGSLPSFVRLELVGNPHLKNLSRNTWKMVSQTLVLEDCPSIDSLPEISQPVNGLTHLIISGCRHLKSFPTGINNLKSLQVIRFTDTDIRSLPACILELDQLSKLDLSSNKSLEFVPNNILKLSKLIELSFSECSRIQSLPELPANLLTFIASGCTSLHALPSNIAKLRWKELFFEDCPQLDTNLPKEIVNNYPNHAMSSLHPQGFIQYSGSEIPKWFAYKSSNWENDSCMMVQLPPPNCTTKRLIKGIVVGVVCSSDIGCIEMSITCDCNIGTTAAVAASWTSPVFGLGLTQLDNVYMWYEANLLGETKELIREEAEPWYERYAGRSVSLRFALQPGKGEDPNRLNGIKIKSIGVSLLY